MNRLGTVRAMQGLMLGRMTSLGFDFQDEAMLTTMSLELVRSSEIEGEVLNMTEVRSSIARRLGIETAGLVSTSRYVDGIVEMLMDATQYYDKPLSDERLFGWHNVLFPTGRSGLYVIEVGKYRTGEMQVVSGPMGHETVHYEAPEPERVPEEMHRLISWVNTQDEIDPVIKAGIAHLWFVSIHPFDDGNGRITRAITDMLLARSEHSSKRFYSMSNEDIVVNERQRKIINMQFDGFFGKLTSGKWAEIGKCSTDTALNDIKNLVNKGMLKKNNEGGRSTNYSLVIEPSRNG